MNNQHLVPPPKRWPLVLFGVVLGAGTAIGAGQILTSDTQLSAAPLEDIQLATVEVTTHDLIEEVEWDGTLGYGNDVSVAGSGGTVTAVGEVGAIVRRGDHLVAVDGKPVTVLYGSVPPYRTLAEGDQGLDVFQLESNLVALGFDPDATVTVDNTFSYNTALMVQRWQESMGFLDVTTVAPSDIVVVPGPSAIRSASELGASANGVIAVVAPQTTEFDLILDAAGTVSQIASSGEEVTDGQILGLVDGIAVIAAVGRPAESVLAEDGTTQRYEITVPAGHIVGEVFRTEGVWAPASRPLLTVTQSQLSVVIPVAASDANEFTLAEKVVIRQVDDSELPGIIETVGTVITTGQDGSSRVDVTVSVQPVDGIELIEGSVVVIAAGEQVLDAMVIPTRALSALLEGGFAVAKADDAGGSSLVGIELGAFDDGLVEVVSVTVGELNVGDRVVVPQ